jgi:hypothetical protein
MSHRGKPKDLPIKPTSLQKSLDENKRNRTEAVRQKRLEPSQAQLREQFMQEQNNLKEGYKTQSNVNLDELLLLEHEIELEQTK